MGAFEETDLLKGEWTVGLKWVFDHKTDSEGRNIAGKKKARLVAQGFNQRPGQYDKTYVPVAKMASVRVLLVWAALPFMIWKFFNLTARPRFYMRKSIILSTADRFLATSFPILRKSFGFLLLCMAFVNRLLSSIL